MPDSTGKRAMAPADKTDQTGEAPNSGRLRSDNVLSMPSPMPKQVVTSSSGVSFTAPPASPEGEAILAFDLSLVAFARKFRAVKGLRLVGVDVPHEGEHGRRSSARERAVWMVAKRRNAAGGGEPAPGQVLLDRR